MTAKRRSIEIDAETADLLEARAASRGLSLAELLADLASNAQALPADLAAMRAHGEGPWSQESLKEDARRLAEFRGTRMGVPWDDAKAWLASWGTPRELPRPKPRKL
jgi:hypothetical protein